MRQFRFAVSHASSTSYQRSGSSVAEPSFRADVMGRLTRLVNTSSESNGTEKWSVSAIRPPLNPDFRNNRSLILPDWPAGKFQTAAPAGQSIDALFTVRAFPDVF